MKKFVSAFLGVMCLCSMAACQNPVKNAVKEAKYSAYEMVGMQKRDLFKKEVKDVKEAQKDTGEEFEDALERLQKIYSVDSGKLERHYTALNSSYEDAEKRAGEVKQNIVQLETVAEDLFKEWRKEIQEMESASLKQKSTATLNETQKKYNEFHANLKKSEAKMGPVLTKLRDHTLYLKHNLNAKAIAGLKSESLKIQGDIESLIKDMNASVAQAESVIDSM